MFEYYWDLFKKNIVIIMLPILIFLIGGFGYYYYKNYKNIDVNKVGNNKVNIKFNKSKKEIKLVNELENDIKKEEINKYSYQVKVFLDKYDLSCEGEKEICEKIIKNKEKINNFILGNYSGELKKLDEFKLNIDEFFEKKFDENVFKLNIIDILYTFQNNLIKQTNIQNTGFEKYFKFKQKNPDDKILLNNMEIQCASEIKMAIIPGTFEEDKIISEKVEQNCKNLGSEKLLTLEDNKLDSKKIENNNITLKLKIKKLKVQYDFFEKNNGKYKKNSSKEIFIDYEKEYNLKKEAEKKDEKSKEKIEETKKEIEEIKEDKKVVEENIENNKEKQLRKKMNDILIKKYRKKRNSILREKYRKKLKK